MGQITIQLQRIGKPTRSFVENLVQDDGVQVQTFTLLPEDISERLSEKFWQQGKIPPGRLIHSAAKHLFYNENYSLVVYRDAAGEPLGCYCDIVTPLQKVGEEFVLTDLILDVWIAPDGAIQVLDEAEFQAAIQHGLVSSEQAEKARTTLESLVNGWKILLPGYQRSKI